MTITSKEFCGSWSTDQLQRARKLKHDQLVRDTYEMNRLLEEIKWIEEEIALRPVDNTVEKELPNARD